MKKTLLLFLFLWAIPSWATAFTSSQSGHCNTNSTWGGTGHPSSSADTATINGGFTVTCDNSDGTFTVGAMTIVSGGKFTVGSGGAVSLNGNVTVNAGGSQFNCTPSTSPATITIVVPTATTRTLQDGGSGSGNVVWNFSGASQTNNCTVVGAITGTGVATFNTGGFANGNTMTMSNAVFRKLGSTTAAVTFNVGGTSTISINNTLFDNDGTINFSFFGNTAGYTWNGLDFRRCIDTSNSYCANINQVSGGAASQRLITNMTAGDIGTSLAPQQVTIAQASVQIGEDTSYGDSVTAPGFYGYNVELNLSANGAAATNAICRMCFIVSDQTTSSNNLITVGSGVGQILQDNYWLDMSQNQHELGGSNPTLVTSNIYQGIISDGNGMVWADTGNIYSGGNTNTVSNNLCINEAGEWTTLTVASAAWGFFNNTSFECRGVDVTTTGPAASSAITAFRNQLIVYPGFSGGLNYDTAGFTKDDAIMTRQASLSLDYNNFWMTPGSGDSMGISTGQVLNAQASCPQSCAIPNNGISSAIPAYIQANGVDTPLQASTITTSGTTTTNVACSTCLFSTNGMQTGDYICDFTTSGGGTQPYTCDAIQLVNSNTQITLKNGISGLVSGHFIVGYTGYMSATSQFYGITAGYGTHDKHNNPQFIDASRNACTWYNAVSGVTSECAGFQTGNIPNTFGMIFTSTSGTGTTTVKCSACDFVTWGISTHSIVQVFSTTTTTIRGLATVSAVGDLHTLTISPAITGFASGDLFTFVTATQGIGRGILTLNGWDYGSSSGQPVAVTPAAWANLPSILSYIRQGFTPMNGQLKNAASPTDCTTNDPLKCDIGAVPGYPATAMVIF